MPPWGIAETKKPAGAGWQRRRAIKTPGQNYFFTGLAAEVVPVLPVFSLLTFFLAGLLCFFGLVFVALAVLPLCAGGLA